MDELDHARTRVLSDSRAWTLFIATASLPFPGDTEEIIKARLWAAWDSHDELEHALIRANGPAQTGLLIAAEKRRWADLIAENERRECAEMKKAA